jgi:TetR/AcrR family transcriptional regulator, transcriptional repressor for nem operon
MVYKRDRLVPVLATEALQTISNEMSKGELTRREIVRKSAPLFNRRGYEGTSLSDLIEATGLQKGGIYRHFSSKQQLAGEAFDYTWEKAVFRPPGRR